MFIRGETLLAHSACPKKIPGWIVLVREKFSVTKRAYKKYASEIVLSGFCLFSFLNFAIEFQVFLLKKLEIIQYNFCNWRAEDNLVVKFMSRNYRSYS